MQLLDVDLSSSWPIFVVQELKDGLEILLRVVKRKDSECRKDCSIIILITVTPKEHGVGVGFSQILPKLHFFTLP